MYMYNFSDHAHTDLHVYAMHTVDLLAAHLIKGTHSCHALDESNGEHQFLWEHCCPVDTATLPMLTQHCQHGPHDRRTHHEA